VDRTAYPQIVGAGAIARDTQDGRSHGAAEGRGGYRIGATGCAGISALFPPPALGSHCPVCRGRSWWRVDGGQWQCWGCAPGPADWQAYPGVDLFNSRSNIYGERECR
jgi:ribosomal protein L37AE/L43A